MPQLKAQSVNQVINQVEQDKARQKSAEPQQSNFLSQRKAATKTTLSFPEEALCLDIAKVVIINTDEKFVADFLTDLTHQAQHKCLGDKGIQLLENAIQNELISRGYITTLIYLPRQHLSSGTLTFQLVPGKVGKIAHSPMSDGWSSLANNLPLRSGDILRLSDLEQGAANLQRIPESLAKIQLLPGSLDGESDIYVTHKQDKYWQFSGWMNDAGSRHTGRNQSGVTFYLYNPTSLNDIFYISLGRDLAFNNHNKGNQNTSIYYSIPWGYWWLDLYTSRSRYLQTLEGNWSQWKYRSHYEYSSVELNRMLSRTMNQQTSVGLQLFKGNSRFYLEDTELRVMQKENPGWKLALRHQHGFPAAATLTTIGFQNRLRWLGDGNTAEQKSGLISKQARIFTLDSQALVKVAAAGPNFSYAPHFNLQVSPDVLTTQNKFTLGNRWTVRGFDGEKSLIQNQGWYFSNDFNWTFPGTEQQLYLGLDIGRIIGASDSGDSGRTLTGSVIGLRGEKWRINYNLFAGTPLSRPDGFTTDDLNLGFSLQWNFRR
nr:ShlB/FhaC/HecB family hemolysin secretion/activation protein [Cedecea colo]